MSEIMSVNIDVPALNVTCNYLIPDDMQISKVVELVTKTLTEEYSGIKDENLSNHMFIRALTGRKLSENSGLHDLGITSGEHLIII